MRIQHNIMAMNAYRNYNTNTSALSKNLEKLSSGYKINRAGDDAAGLAISEKMRAQITGLNAAQKNVKDGISLVKTAEGAMQEIQDMLNRMDYLATQSANGTYDNEVDRANLQKEVDALKSEIDRIAESANFNGIKLLDGSLESDDKVTVKDATIGGLTNVDLASVWSGAVGGTPATDKIQYHKDAAGSAKTSFEVRLDQVARQMTNANSDEDSTITGYFELRTIDGTKEMNMVAGTETFAANAGVQYTVGTDNNGNVSGSDLAAAIKEAILASGNGADANAGTVKLKLDADTEIEYKVEIGGENNDTLVFTMTDSGYNAAVKKKEDAVFRGNFGFAVSQDDGTGTAFNRVGKDGIVDPTKDDGTKMNAYADWATSNIQTGRANAGTQYATFVHDPSNTIKDGTGFKIGDEYYVFATSKATAQGQYGDKVHVVDLTDLVANDGDDLSVTTATPGTTGGNNTNYDKLTEALSRLSHAAKDNEMFDVQISDEGALIGFTEKATYKGDADLTNYKGIQAQVRSFSSIKQNVETTPAKGKALTLQIGDTSDSYNQLKVKVGDMHTTALGIGDLDISNPESASAAIQTIKDAINQVSSVRGDLGATQNRLEHTANNLSVMAENIQDAESTIRDTDVAEEMMAYTKNNILIQSAQAMLAQANAVPQGVLQLLG